MLSSSSNHLIYNILTQKVINKFKNKHNSKTEHFCLTFVAILENRNNFEVALNNISLKNENMNAASFNFLSLIERTIFSKVDWFMYLPNGNSVLEIISTIGEHSN